MSALKWVRRIFFGIGLFMLLLAIAIAFREYQFLHKAQKVEGVVEDLVGSKSFAPVFKFTPQGSPIPIKIKSHTSTNPPAYSVGEKVTVYYDPEDPMKAELDGTFSLWGGAIIVGILGLVFSAVGGGMIFFSHRRQKQIEALKSFGHKITAEYHGYEINRSIRVNGSHPYRLLAKWKNPATQQVHILKSDNLWGDIVISEDTKTMTVYMDPTDPNKYYMDTDESFS